MLLAGVEELLVALVLGELRLDLPLHLNRKLHECTVNASTNRFVVRCVPGRTPQLAFQLHELVSDLAQNVKALLVHRIVGLKPVTLC